MTSDNLPPEAGALTRRELRSQAQAASSSEAAAEAQDDLAPEIGSRPEIEGSAQEESGTAAALIAELTEAGATAEDGGDESAAAGDEPARSEDESRPDETDAEVTATEDVPSEPAAQWAGAAGSVTALTWVNPDTVSLATIPASLDAPASPGKVTDILAGARLRSGFWRPGILVPLGALLVLVGGYVGSTLLWPLHNVAPLVTAATVQTSPAPAAELVWPEQGSAAIDVAGVSSATNSSTESPIASITKVVSVLMVLDNMPLQLGEQGPSFGFTSSDQQTYWDYLYGDQSVLDVPVDGSLTEYQMLQGILLGSANNYIDRLAEEIWGTDEAFATAATEWLAAKGLGGITLANPSGFNAKNTATPEALLALADLALQNPVFAEIVATPVVELPGAGVVENTNPLLSDPGVIGVKTGRLFDDWNLLTAKNVMVGETTVRLNVAVLGQQDDEARAGQSRALLAQVEEALQAQGPVVAAGTVVGSVATAWGAQTELVTDADASVVLWNGASAQAAAALDFSLEDDEEKGSAAGTLTVDGPINDAEVSVSTTSEVPGPSIWWRLTHPLQLFGVLDATVEPAAD